MANLNFNKIILGGRICRDPELKTSQTGMQFTQFSVACSRKGKDAKTDFFDCTAFGKTAELVSSRFKKGSSILIVGRVQIDDYQAKDGSKGKRTSVMVDEVNFVDSLNESQSATAQPSNTGYMPQAYTSAPQFEDLNDGDELPF